MFGVRMREDDYVKRPSTRPPSPAQSQSPPGPQPSFLVWTGAPFVFNGNRAMETPTPSCARNYQVLYRIANGAAPWHEEIVNSSPVQNCFARVPVPLGVLMNDNPPPGTVTVEYKVRTWDGVDAAGAPLRFDSPDATNQRESTKPGNGLWQATGAAEFPASVFFLTESGAPSP
jgi:hypothetical protein